jgi:hypothetical protein
VSGQLHTLITLDKNPQYPLDGRLGGTQSQSGQHGKLHYYHYYSKLKNSAQQDKSELLSLPSSRRNLTYNLV